MGKQRSGNRTEEVDDYMAGLYHPLKAETELLRRAIRAVNPEITEQVKWNAPSFGYKGEYLVTFNFRNPKHVHLVFHNPVVADVESDVLEGNYPGGRRMAYFRGRTDVEERHEELERVIRELVNMIDPK